MQSQLAEQGARAPTQPQPAAEAGADATASSSASEMLAAAVREVDALAASASERGAGEAADLERLTALLRSTLIERSVPYGAPVLFGGDCPAVSSHSAM